MIAFFSIRYFPSLLTTIHGMYDRPVQSIGDLEDLQSYYFKS